MKNTTSLLLIVAALFCVAGAKNNKKTFISVRFHPETSETDGAPFIMPVHFEHARKKGFVEKMAVIDERYITGVFSFPARNGTMGAAFYLNSHGRNLLDNMTIESRGKSVVAIVNSRQVTDILIDRRVSDGIITIPSGLTPEEITLMKGKFKNMNPVEEVSIDDIELQ